MTGSISKNDIGLQDLSQTLINHCPPVDSIKIDIEYLDLDPKITPQATTRLAKSLQLTPESIEPLDIDCLNDNCNGGGLPLASAINTMIKDGSKEHYAVHTCRGVDRKKQHWCKISAQYKITVQYRDETQE